MSLYLRDTWREANTICGVLPMNPSSSGIWPSTKLQDPKANIEFWNYMFPHVEIIFLIVTVLWQFFHFFFKRLGMIRFTSHMLVSKSLKTVSYFDSSSTKCVLFADRNSSQQVVYEREYTREEFLFDRRLQRHSVWSGWCVFLHDVLVLDGS